MRIKPISRWHGEENLMNTPHALASPDRKNFIDTVLSHSKHATLVRAEDVIHKGRARCTRQRRARAAAGARLSLLPSAHAAAYRSRNRKVQHFQVSIPSSACTAGGSNLTRCYSFDDEQRSLEVEPPFLLLGVDLGLELLLHARHAVPLFLRRCVSLGSLFVIPATLEDKRDGCSLPHCN